MATKLKACKKCRSLHNEDKCPKCGGVSTESWKGKIEIFTPENSQISEKLQLKEKGLYAVKAE